MGSSLLLGEVDGSRSVLEALEARQTIFTSLHRVSLSFYVLSDTTTRTEKEVMDNCVELPRIYETYTTDADERRTCINVQGREISTISHHPTSGLVCILWMFSCEFSDEVDFYQQNISDENQPPDEKYCEVRWSTEEITEVTNVKPNGSLLMTTAGEPLFYERKIICALMTVTQYEEYPFDYNTIIDYVDHVNSDVFLDAAIGSVKCKKIDTDPQTINGLTYDFVTYQFSFRIEKVLDGSGFDTGDQYLHTWRQEVLNCGHRYIHPATMTVRIFKLHGDPAKVNLDDNGFPLGPDDIGLETYIPIPPKIADFNNLITRIRFGP